MQSGAASAPIWIMQPSPPPPTPKQDDAAVLEAARRERVTNDGLAGRGATLLAGKSQPDPARRTGSKLLGQFGTLG